MIADPLPMERSQNWRKDCNAGKQRIVAHGSEPPPCHAHADRGHGDHDRNKRPVQDADSHSGCCNDQGGRWKLHRTPYAGACIPPSSRSTAAKATSFSSRRMMPDDAGALENETERDHCKERTYEHSRHAYQCAELSSQLLSDTDDKVRDIGTGQHLCDGVAAGKILVADPPPMITNSRYQPASRSLS